jgi:hypothetical protein
LIVAQISLAGKVAGAGRMARLAVLATVLAVISQVYGEEPSAQPDCPKGEGWVECRAAAGDKLAIYRLGRTAYENARESGDFTEALRLARQLNASGDKNGERLLKMVHLQLGWGTHKDYVQAYAWLVEDMSKNDEHLPKMLKQLAEKMTPEQITQAKALAGR